MASPVGPIVAVVTGVVLAGGAAVGIVNSQTGATPNDQPVVVYGNSSPSPDTTS